MPAGFSFSAAAFSRAPNAFHPSMPVTFPALATMMSRLPRIWFSSIAFWMLSGEIAVAELCVDRQRMPRSSISFRTSLAACGVHEKYGE